MVREQFAVGHDGTRIYVRTRERDEPPAGDGARVRAVLCDGIACDGFIWKYLWNDLAGLVDLAHWNYRGHGRSGLPVDPSAIEVTDHARDLAAVRAAIGAGDPSPLGPSSSAPQEPVVLIGHSFGCQVVLEHMRHHPGGVRGLVLICGAPGRVTHSFKGTDVLAQILPRVIERVEARPELARALWSRLPPPLALRFALLTGEVDRRSITPEDLMPYMRHMVDIDALMFLRMLRSAGDHSASDLLPRLDIPALVIGGDRDSFTPSRLAEEMAAMLPQGELLMVTGGTHVVPLERKELVRERVEHFLQERVLAPTSSSPEREQVSPSPVTETLAEPPARGA
ncbi:alpha/beta fold hydrolase [Chondromyces apiculatus]|uniref:Beta-ketoadipate enol-lactone hydrolase n=1 Tax=Chondromyces apiculatus DSM 436 TaxID=1192034 RepID=A0A017T4T5_9BACT|nr:alpha/beta hydrolase [Chondromyces apiculatus]EYF04012.1 Beta-ketoadipate enol-lactone hydrolase [Chondromyces apiculatus DSM 436]